MENQLVESKPPARILIVDDNPAIHDDFRKILSPGYDTAELDAIELAVFGATRISAQKTVYEIDSAEQGQEGLTLVKSAIENKSPYSLAFVDMRMPPGWDGIETIRNLWQADPKLQVVICTAFSDYSWEDIIESFGHNDQLLILKKPFDYAEVSQLAVALTEKKRLLDLSDCYTNSLETRVLEQTQTIRTAHEETIHRLVRASMFRDEETGAHIRRVGLFSAIIAKAVGWNDSEVEQIRMAAPMHDVGKIGIPDFILQKPGPLTDDERTVMQSHTVIGAELLSESASPMLRMACEIAMHHHEFWDGSGYPHKLKGTEIPMAARIVGIADVYDALSNDRVYRPAFPRDKTLAMLREGRGTQFDPELLDLFFELVPAIEQVALDNLDECPGLPKGQLPAPAKRLPSPTL